MSNPKTPNIVDQKDYVYERLNYYVSTYDYLAIAAGFETAWCSKPGDILGDGDFKNAVYQYLEIIMDENFIPQNIVDDVVDLMLEYLESIGAWGDGSGQA